MCMFDLGECSLFGQYITVGKFKISFAIPKIENTTRLHDQRTYKCTEEQRK